MVLKNDTRQKGKNLDSSNTVIRFTVVTDKSNQGSGYNLTAAVEDDPGCQWRCHLVTKSSQSKVELSIEVSPSKTNKTPSVGRIPLFFYDIYQSDALRPARNESPDRARIDLMVVSRAAFPSAAFHNLGRTSITKDGIAAWLTTVVSASLQKILRNGFDEPVKQLRTPKFVPKKIEADKTETL